MATFGDSDGFGAEKIFPYKNPEESADTGLESQTLDAGQQVFDAFKLTAL